MSEQDLIDRLRQILGDVAPDLDVATVAIDADLRNDIGLDSMDFLNFVIAISRQLGVAIPEADYGKVATLGKCSAYVTTQNRRQTDPPRP